MKKKLTPAAIKEYQRAEVLRMYGEGFTIRDIIEEVNMTFGQVEYYLKAKGVYKKKGTMILTRDKREELVMIEFEKGKSRKEIAYELGLPEMEVYSVLSQYDNVQKFYFSGKAFGSSSSLRMYRKELRQKVRDLFEKGMSRKEICEKFSITNYSLGHLLNRG